MNRRSTFRILGTLEGWYGDKPLKLGGTLRERTLAMLLLEANRVVSVSRLVEAAWDDDPPSSASHQIRKAVAELRQRIPGGAELIVTDGPGYRARIGEAQLDLLQHQAQVRRAREAIRKGGCDEAADQLQSALDLWRGPVMAGTGGQVIDGLAAALEEQYLNAAEQLFELRLAAGAAGHIIGELRSLVNQHPLRETLRGQLMLALYRAGRQAEALEEYGRVRELLAEELGIDPSTALAELYGRMLRQSPDLTALARPDPQRADPRPTATELPARDQSATDRSATDRPVTDRPATDRSGRAEPAADPPPAAGPSALPYDLRDFSGRAAELRWISEVVGEGADEGAHIIAIDGMGGSGKTALAVHAAHLLAERYPDGQLFVDLCGFTPGQEPLSPTAAQDALLASAGVPSDDLPGDAAGRTALWRSITTQRSLLIVLDNAADTEQIRSLVPASPGCLTLVTSRPRLVDLDGARWLSLDVLSEQDSAELLRRTLGAERVAREASASAELIRLCGHLPLAVRISTARLRYRTHWSIQHLADRLRDETRRLAELDSAGRSVAVALRLSFQALDAEQRTAFRLLGLHPGRSVDAHEAGALFGMSAAKAEEILEHLLDVHLLEQHEPGWYRFHDLVRSYASGLVGAQDEAQPEGEALRRLMDHYVLTAEAACDALFPERSRYQELLPPGESAHPAFEDAEQALGWLDRQRDSLLSAVDLAHRHGLLRHAAYLPRELGFHSHVRNYPHALHEASQIGVKAARSLRDTALLRLGLTNLAVAQWKLGMFREGAVSLQEALELARSLGDRHSEAICLGRLGQVYNSLGAFGEALGFLREAAVLEEQLGLVREEAVTLNILSSVNVRLGDFEEAAATAERSISYYEEIGEVSNCIVALSSLALALLGLGRPEKALDRLRKALSLCERLGEPANTALILAQCADALVYLDRPGDARAYAERATELAGKGETKARQATVDNSAGRVHRALGELPQALKRHQRAYELASEITFRYEAAMALAGLAEVSQALGGLTAAQDYRRQAERLFDAMGVPERARGFG